MTKTKEANKDKRVRNWTFIVYPESAPQNWREIISDLHTPFVVSPLHDMDVNPDGEMKKSHWHVLIMFPGNKSFEQIESITKSLSSPVPQKVENTKGIVRYFLHMDNPEKYQYKRSDMKAYCGADLNQLLEVTKSDRYALIREMMEFINKQGITEMKDLLDYAMDERFEDWFPLLCDNSAYIVDSYIKSNRHGYGKDFKE